MDRKFRIGFVLFIFWLCACSENSGEATRVGQAVLDIRQALHEPDLPDAGRMEAITRLGHDSRYYTMVRGWLVQELKGLESIRSARGAAGDTGDLERRIEFLGKAIRALDLE